MFEIRKLFAVLLLIVFGCAPSTESEVSMVALIANAGNYDNKRIKTYGFLELSQSARLYLSREDARYRNDIQSILIDDLTLPQRHQLAACDKQFVSVVGTFRLKNSVLALTETQRMNGRSRNKYVELVCNYQFN